MFFNLHYTCASDRPASWRFRSKRNIVAKSSCIERILLFGPFLPRRLFASTGLSPKHLHGLCNNFGRVSGLAVFLPRPRLQPAFDIDLAALLQILSAYLRQAIPCNCCRGPDDRDSVSIHAPAQGATTPVQAIRPYILKF